MIPQAGNVTMGADVRYQCPSSSGFLDSFGGLYAPGHSYAVRSSSLCETVEGKVLVSTLEYSCVPCADGRYTTQAGSSTGFPGEASNSPCLECPGGGLCTGGSVRAAAGYWGASDGQGEVSFTLCPAGYCCDGVVWPCVTMNSCAGNRTGILCSQCPPGYVEAIGSSSCILSSACDADLPLVWTATVIAVFMAACIELVLVSGVWLTTTRVPSANFKLVVYFTQVR